MKVALFGASGKTGRYLLTRLLDDGHDVAAIGRDAGRLAATDGRARRRLADLDDADATRRVLEDAECVVSLAHARFIPALIAALPKSCDRLIVTGSTRKFTRFPDAAADAVRKGEAAFRSAGVPGMMLHPSMIYGAPDDRNVNRLLRLIARWPRRLPMPFPLPRGGRTRVQPIFVDDVVDAFAAAVRSGWSPDEPIVLAGPKPITYRFMVACCAEALGRHARVFTLPRGLMAALSRIGPFGADEVRRLTEDKAFDVTPLVEALGVRPRHFRDGLRKKLQRGWAPVRTE